MNQLVAGCLHLEEAPSLVSLCGNGRRATATLLRGTACEEQLSTPLPVEDAYLVNVQLSSKFEKSLWTKGRLKYRVASKRGSVCFLHLEDQPQIELHSNFMFVQFYLPTSCFDVTQARSIGTLRPPELGSSDAVILYIAAALAASLESSSAAPQLFTDSLFLALRSHIALKYGDEVQRSTARRETLAPWQVRRATELMSAHPSSNLSLALIAEECRLSVGHFARGFRNSVGQTVHQWHLTYRMEHAKNLLKTSMLPIAELALECGFAHRVPFTKAFNKVVGTTPGQWRRLHYTMGISKRGGEQIGSR